MVNVFFALYQKKFQILLKENVLSFLCKWIGSFLPDQSFVLGKAKYNKKIFKHYFPPFFQTPLMVKFVLNVPYKKRDSHWGWIPKVVKVKYCQLQKLSIVVKVLWYFLLKFNTGKIMLSQKMKQFCYTFKNMFSILTCLMVNCKDN